MTQKVSHYKTIIKSYYSLPKIFNFFVTFKYQSSTIVYLLVLNILCVTFFYDILNNAWPAEFKGIVKPSCG